MLSYAVGSLVSPLEMIDVIQAGSLEHPKGNVAESSYNETQPPASLQPR